MQNCYFCDDRKCEGCPLPYTDEFTYADFLRKLDVNTNESFYSDNNQIKGKKDIILDIVFSREFKKETLDAIQNAKVHPSQKNTQEESKDGHITLGDCLLEFKQPEMLDEDNKWYCGGKCKTHVQATKQLEIYRPPPVLVISLKRFKTGRNKMSMYGGGGQKLSTLVDFPLEGLNLAPFVLSAKEGENLIYDCFAVSNHFGSLGFGHYTAFAQHWKEKQWYNYDDSSCSKITSSRVVSDSAYNLFYRRRDYVDLENINYDQIKLVPDPQFNT